MAQKVKSSFRGKVASNAIATSKSNSSYGYLSLPKGVSVFTPDPEGKYFLDFLPYVITDPRHPDRKADLEVAVPDSLWWRRPFRIHRNVGAGQGDTVVCLSSVGKKCPICEHKAKLVKQGTATKEEIKALNSSKRMLYIVIPLGSKDFEEGIHIFDISENNFQDKLTNELKEDDKYEIFPDLAEGYTLKVRFEGKTIGTGKPFPVADRIDFETRDQQYDESILDSVPNLDEILYVMSYAELEAKFLEMEEEDAGKIVDVDEAPKPARSRFAKPKEEEEEEAPKSKRKPAPVEEEEEEEEAPKRPVRGTPTTKKRPAVEEEEEEEEKPRKSLRKPIVEEEEEEEETPAPKRGASASKPAGKNKCPQGYKFGVDTDKYKQCDTCDIWSDCIAKKEEGN